MEVLSLLERSHEKEKMKGTDVVRKQSSFNATSLPSNIGLSVAKNNAEEQLDKVLYSIGQSVVSLLRAFLIDNTTSQEECVSWYELCTPQHDSKLIVGTLVEEYKS